MIPISADSKQRFMRGDKQYARLTMERSPYEPTKADEVTVPFSFESENIFTREGETQGKYINSSGTESSSSNFYHSDYIEVQPNKRYVIDDMYYGVTQSVYHAFYDENKTLLRVTHVTQEGFITPPDAKYWILSYHKNYIPTNVHIAVGKIAKGTLNVTTGVLTVEHGYIEDLSHYIYSKAVSSMEDVYATNYLSGAYNPTQAGERIQNISCSIYPPSDGTGTNPNAFTMYSMLFVGSSTARTANGRFYFRDDRTFADLAAFREAMEGVQATFPLEHSCVYQLTPAEVSTLLNKNEVSTDCGGLRIVYRTTAGTEKTASKNLLNTQLVYSKYSGVTFIKNPDNSVRCYGTATALISVPITDDNNYVELKSGKQYFLSGCPYGGDNSTYDLRLTTTPTGTTVICLDYGDGVAFSVESDTNAGARLVIRSGVTVDFTFRPMVVEGSTATEYEGYYQPIVSIPDGANNIPVTSLTASIEAKQDFNGYGKPWAAGDGKNKFGATAQDFINGETVGAGKKVTFSLKPNTTYTLSSNEPNGTTSAANIWFNGTSSSGNGVWINHPMTTTTDANGELYVLVRTTEINNVLSNYWIQLEEGSSPTSYEPYENICPITGYDAVTVTRTGTNTFNANNFVLQSGSGLTIEDANTILMEATSGMENKNEYPLTKGYARTLKFLSDSLRTVGMTETWEVYQRVNGVLTSIAHVEQSNGVKTVVASVSADADAIVFGGWSGTNTVCELKNIRLDIGEITANLVIENADIVDGGYSINRYVCTGDSLQFGSCVSAELSLALDNYDGRFNDESFMSKEIHAEVGVKDENDTIQYISLGYFTVDESPKKLSKINLAALDRMMKFEKKVDATLLSFPVTLYELLARICEICGVDLGTASYNFLHANYNVMEFPAIAQTYRDILSYICEINGSCAYMDCYGRLRLGWFSSEPAVTLDTSNRFDSDIDENAVIIYGVSVITETESYHAGTIGFDIQIGHNPLITYDEQEIANALFQKVGGFTYFPFTATTMPMPFLFPMDGATFIDKDGNSHFVAITDITFRLNRNTALSGKGQTVRETDYERKYGVSATYANVDEALEIIKNTIIKNAEITNERMDQMVQTFTGMYEAQSSEYGAFKQETNARLTQNAEGLTQAYTNIQQIDSKYGVAITDTNDAIVQLADGAVATNTNFRSVTEAYIKSGLLFYEGLDPVYGVAVGQLTYETINGEKLIKRQGVYSVFTAEELAFYVNDVKVAYMKNNKLYINNAEFLYAVQIGDYTLSANGNGFTIK